MDRLYNMLKRLDYISGNQLGINALVTQIYDRLFRSMYANPEHTLQDLLPQKVKWA